MKGINKAIIVGNLGNDPDIKATSNGSTIANLSVATSEAWRDKSTGEMQERTEWHRIVLFNRLAEIAEQYLRKGSKIYIEGKIQTRKWQDQSGQDRYSTEIVGNELQMLDSRGDNGQANQASNSNGFAQNQPQFSAGNQATGFSSQSQGSNNFASQNPQNMSNNEADFGDDVPF